MRIIEKTPKLAGLLPDGASGLAVGTVLFVSLLVELFAFGYQHTFDENNSKTYPQKSPSLSLFSSNNRNLSFFLKL
jgi:hypothetical protein